MLELGRVACAMEMDLVIEAVVDKAVSLLSPSNCIEVVRATIDLDLPALHPVKEASLAMTLEEFEVLAQNDAFTVMEEDHLALILGDNRLQASGEEQVLEAAARWICGRRGDDGGNVGAQVLAQVRFGLLEDGALEAAASRIPGHAVLERMAGDARGLRALPEDRRAPRPVAPPPVSVEVDHTLADMLARRR